MNVDPTDRLEHLVMHPSCALNGDLQWMRDMILAHAEDPTLTVCEKEMVEWLAGEPRPGFDEAGWMAGFALALVRRLM